jgi:phosphodiesterase/alkaline phosphatase D-like protein
MVFRVRVGDLQPQTTYYYKVSSKQADGIFDPATSGVNQFTTQPTNQMSAEK